MPKKPKINLGSNTAWFGKHGFLLSGTRTDHEGSE